MALSVQRPCQESEREGAPLRRLKLDDRAQLLRETAQSSRSALIAQAHPCAGTHTPTSLPHSRRRCSSRRGEPACALGSSSAALSGEKTSFLRKEKEPCASEPPRLSEISTERDFAQSPRQMPTSRAVWMVSQATSTLRVPPTTSLNGTSTISPAICATRPLRSVSAR